MKFIKPLNEKKPKGAPDFHHSDAPDAEGRFRDLGIKDLAAWLIKTRKKDVKKISGSLTQQVVFNRNDDPEYAEKMEKVRKEVYKQLGRQDLIDKMDESVNEGKMPDKYIGNDEIVYLKTKEDSRGAHYNLYYKGHDIEVGGVRFGSEKELEDFASNYALSNQLYRKLRYEDSIPLPESIDGLDNAKFRLEDVYQHLGVEYGKTRRGDKYVQINHIPVSRPQSQQPEFVKVFYDNDKDLKKIGKELNMDLKESVALSSGSKIVKQFRKELGSQQCNIYDKRDNCGPAASDFVMWTELNPSVVRQYGIKDLKIIRGFFKGDIPVSAKKDFTREMKKEFLKDGGNWNNDKERFEWISNSKYAEQWKYIPHYWVEDSKGKIYDPVGQQQFIDAGYSEDLNSDRYTLSDDVQETFFNGKVKGEQSRLNEEDSYNDYPAAAKKNAQIAIDWKEKYGRDEVPAGTPVGWARAHQLAKGEKISADTVKRMSAFNRHRKNSSIAPEHKDEPWKDNGYVAWLIWGGDEGVDWAIEKSKEIDAMKESKQMKFIKPLHEAKLSKIHNAAKKGSYPVTLVVIENGKVVKQELVGTPQIVPAAFNQLKKEYPKATVHVESKTGERLFSESVVNEGYWSHYEYEKWTKENGKPKYPKWVKTTLKEIVKGGFMDPVYDAEHNYMVLWLASLEIKRRSELYAYDNKGKKEFGKVGYAMYQRFYNDLTGYNMFFMQGAMYALEVSKQIQDRIANGESVEPAYYMMKEYFNNFGMDTKRSRVFNAAYEKLEKWMKDNNIKTL